MSTFTSAAFICPCCGANTENAPTQTKLPFFLFKVRNARIVNCPECGLGITRPAPNMTTHDYQVREGRRAFLEPHTELYRKFARDILNFVFSVQVTTPVSSILDVGCGGAFLLEEAVLKGINAEGIEADAELISWGQERGLAVSNASLQEIFDSGKRYDVVVFSAVLEHVEDPYGLLQQALKILNPGGFAVVGQSACDGLLPKLFPWGWYPWQPHEHYWHFTEKSFKRGLEVRGLESILISKESLHHPWMLSLHPLKLARNLSALLARLGTLCGMPDGFAIAVR